MQHIVENRTQAKLKGSHVLHSTPTGAEIRSSISEVSYDSRPPSRASSLDLSGPELIYAGD